MTQERKQKEKESDEKLTYDKERSDWISKFGSPRLKRLVKEGIGHNQTYLQERIALEMPGWKLYDGVCGEKTTIRDAEQWVIDKLDSERESNHGAYLGWLRDGCHVDGCGHRDGAKFTSGPALFVEFIGNTLVKVL